MIGAVSGFDVFGPIEAKDEVRSRLDGTTQHDDAERLRVLAGLPAFGARGN